ncbi:MAG: competence protein ComEA, competence protein ComEA [Berkelbacteria bacterium GW2011_GWE1_39_12]|uniref:Competence protein ComEA, competence protein ComEA n=1 Tax=Berkelbacteria bacterium GW2011_GWE1_39_12 TaxID=1618337 RepID=A0A0G4B3N0_9BACT|nr:MAG: competence protein ComEA, competence protein ComEA [Berkelbacteria bacterium GW2011_GWE1_39_12]
MNEFDKLIYQYRFIVGGVLIAVILTGSGLLVWEKIVQSRQSKNEAMELLEKENEALRQELSGQAKVVAGSEASVVQGESDKININTAALTDLDKIPSVGPVIAQRIIDYRNENGAFKTIEDLKKVKGIGEKTFEKISGSITAGE